MSKYSPFVFKNKTALVNNFIVLWREACSDANYSLFDIKPSKFALKMIEKFHKNSKSFELSSERDRDFFNILPSVQDWEEKLYLYAEIASNRAQKAIVRFVCGSRAKIWVNGRCALLSVSGWADSFFTVDLDRGNNAVLIEFFANNPDRRFSFQLLDYAHEQSGEATSLAALGGAVEINPLTAVCGGRYIASQNEFEFMFFANEFSGIEKNCKIRVTDSVGGSIVNFSAKTNKPIKIEVDRLKNFHPEPIRYVEIKCFCKTADGKKIDRNILVVPTDFEGAVDQIAAKTFDYAKSLSIEEYFNVKGRYDNLYKSRAAGDMVNTFFLTAQIKHLYDQFLAGNFIHNTKEIEGIHDYFLHSELDDSIVRVLVKVPKGYDKREKYPAIFSLNTVDCGTFGLLPASGNFPAPCLCFDISGRGFTGGSYVGEAHILEMMRWAFDNYSVDCDRIYMLGTSNGGYATYAMAQNYPHLNAAIFPLVGYPNVDTIENISNLPTYQMVSNKDSVFYGRRGEVKKLLAGYGNYTQLDFIEMVHNHFTVYIYHKKFLAAMASARRERYPKKIAFKTARNRHLRSFWAEINGIAAGRRSAELHAEVIDGSHIKIKLTGADGITLNLPPYIERDLLDIDINGQSLPLSNCARNLILVKKRGRWGIGLPASVDYRKGTGILDVYLGSMRVIIPRASSDKLQRVAGNFARPGTNGIDPSVYVNYPIYPDNSLPEHIFSHNLVVFDVCRNNAVLNRIKDRLAVQYDERGYSYKNERTEGDYLIMQAIENPYDAKKTILLISYNNEKMLNCIFTRRVSLPYYFSGFHPYLNNEALIYSGKKFFGIFEKGGKCRAIE